MTARTLALEALHAWQEAQTFRERIEAHTLGLKAIAALEAETGEPYAWTINASSRMWFGDFAEDDAKAEAARCGGTCEAFPLYTAPPPAVPQSDNEDFRDVWQSVMALRGLMNSGHIKPDQDQRDKLVLAAEIDKYVKQIQERDL